MFKMKLLYFGPNVYIEIVNDFKEVNEFIFVDSLPRNYEDNNKFNPEKFDRVFISKLLKKTKKMGFELVEKKTLEYLFDEEYANPTLMIFNNQTQKIKYYVSTNITYNMNKYLQNDIEESDGLIVSGYFPHRILLDYFIKPMNYYGYCGTNYDIKGNEDSILFMMNAVESTHFDKYYLIDHGKKQEVEKNIFFPRGNKNLIFNYK